MSQQTPKEAKLSKSEQAYQYLRRRIINLELKSGERIVISQVAKQLSISEIPVREALNRLESEGFVTAHRNSGFQVVSSSLAETAEKLEVLATLEMLAARKAAKGIEPEDVEAIQAIVNNMAKLVRSKDYLAYFHELKRFYLAMYKHSGNAALYRQLESLYYETGVLDVIYAMAPNWCESSLRKNTAIWKSVRERKPDLAAKQVYELKSKAYALVSEQIKHDLSIF